MYLLARPYDMSSQATFHHGPFPFLHHLPETLPEHIRRIDKLSIFKRQLKSHLFHQSAVCYDGLAWTELVCNGLFGM